MNITYYAAMETFIQEFESMLNQPIYFSAWEVQTNGLVSLLQGCDEADPVWSCGDGGYAVGDIPGDLDFLPEDHAEFIEIGTVADILGEQ